MGDHVCVCVESVTAVFSLSSRNVPERFDLLCLHISLDIPCELGHSVGSLAFSWELAVLLEDQRFFPRSDAHFVLSDHLGERKQHCLDTGFRILFFHF